MGPLKIKIGLPTIPICQRALITHGQLITKYQLKSLIGQFNSKGCQSVIIVYWLNCLKAISNRTAWWLVNKLLQQPLVYSLPLHGAYWRKSWSSGNHWQKLISAVRERESWRQARLISQSWDLACLQQLSERVSHNIEEKSISSVSELMWLMLMHYLDSFYLYVGSKVKPGSCGVMKDKRSFLPMINSLTIIRLMHIHKLETLYLNCGVNDQPGVILGHNGIILSFPFFLIVSAVYYIHIVHMYAYHALA